MTTDFPGQQLHDRATRGDALSKDERTQLDEWYARLDAEEGMIYARAAAPQLQSILQAEIDRTLSQLAAVSQSVQTLTAENAAVRSEIATLQALVALKLTAQPA
jgi:hypothetical protein